MKPQKILFFAVILLAGISLVPAATVSWSAPQGITGDSDVSTTGILVVAANFAGSATTINGVNFSAYSGTISGVSDTFDLNPGSVFGFAATPYNTLSSTYQALVNSGRYTDGATLETLNLTGLSIGQTYQVQFWVNDSRGASSGWSRTLQITAGTSTTLDYNVQNQGGGLGQYVLGSFTANATTQSFDLLGGHPSGSTSASTQLNGFQLRNITVAPEPSVILLGGAGLLVLLRRKRS